LVVIVVVALGAGAALQRLGSEVLASDADEAEIRDVERACDEVDHGALLGAPVGRESDRVVDESLRAEFGRERRQVAQVGFGQLVLVLVDVRLVDRSLATNRLLGIVRHVCYSSWSRTERGPYSTTIRRLLTPLATIREPQYSTCFLVSNDCFLFLSIAVYMVLVGR